MRILILWKDAKEKSLVPSIWSTERGETWESFRDGMRRQGSAVYESFSRSGVMTQYDCSDTGGSG